MARAARVALTVLWFLTTETVILAAAVLPALVGGAALLRAADPPPAIRLVLLALLLVPGIFFSGLFLLLLSAAACRVMRWHTPGNADLAIAPLEWPLLRWVCYAACTHAATVLVGSWLRASPVWSWYLRANGARIGRGVYVNSTNLSDHNLLALDDGVIIGSDVHLSGHTVERGRLITGSVHVARDAVIGVGCVIGIGVDIGAGAQVGALSLVPKHVRLAAGGTYGGIPVRRLEGHASIEQGS